MGNGVRRDRQLDLPSLYRKLASLTRLGTYCCCFYRPSSSIVCRVDVLSPWTGERKKVAHRSHFLIWFGLCYTRWSSCVIMFSPNRQHFLCLIYYISIIYLTYFLTQLGELSQSNQRLELSSTRLDETQRRLDSRLGVISKFPSLYFVWLNHKELLHHFWQCWPRSSFSPETACPLSSLRNSEKSQARRHHYANKRNSSIYVAVLESIAIQQTWQKAKLHDGWALEGKHVHL